VGSTSKPFAKCDDAKTDRRFNNPCTCGPERKCANYHQGEDSIGQSGLRLFSVGGDSLHLCYTYWACGGWQGTIRVTTPCSTSYEAVGPPSDQYQGQSVCLDIPLFEPGTYEITTPGTPNCPPGPCGYSSNCREYLHFWDDYGNHYYPPGPDPTGAYLYSGSTICTEKDLEPQTSDTINIVTYREDEIFYLNNGADLAVQMCAFKPCSTGRICYGWTWVIPSLPGDPYLPSAWRPMNDARVSICLDQANGRWIPRLTIPRMAIFSSACPANVLNLTNLESGCNPNKLDEKVLSEADYEDLIDDLEDYWIPGPYAPWNINRGPKKYWFSEGIEWHEFYHQLLETVNIRSKLNGAFTTIFNLQYPQTQYPCAGDVAGPAEAAAKSIAEDTLKSVYNRFNSMEQGDQNAEELGADEAARQAYKSMLKCVVLWGEAKEWE
jgi:hypothetical protein